MSRPRLPIGTFGEFRFQSDGKGGTRARAQFRDWDGVSRQVPASGPTRAAAERALKVKLLERTSFQPAELSLTPDSTFAALVEFWLADLDLEGRIAKSTRQRYE